MYYLPYYIAYYYTYQLYVLWLLSTWYRETSIFIPIYTVKLENWQIIANQLVQCLTQLQTSASPNLLAQGELKLEFRCNSQNYSDMASEFRCYN